MSGATEGREAWRLAWDHCPHSESHDQDGRLWLATDLRCSWCEGLVRAVAARERALAERILTTAADRVLERSKGAMARAHASDIKWIRDYGLDALLADEGASR